MNFKINLTFLIEPFFLNDQTVKPKIKYLENEKSFSDEIKSIFHHFWRAIIEANKKNYFEDVSLTLNEIQATKFQNRGLNPLNQGLVLKDLYQCTCSYRTKLLHPIGFLCVFWIIIFFKVLLSTNTK